MTGTARAIIVVAALCVGIWGLYRVFTRWESSVPTATHAADEMLGCPFVADQETSVFHKRRCKLLGGKAVPKKSGSDNSRGNLVGYDTPRDARADNYHPCDHCNP